MNEDKKRQESMSELIDELETIRERLFHVQKSLEKLEPKSRETTSVNSPDCRQP